MLFHLAISKSLLIFEEDLTFSSTIYTYCIPEKPVTSKMWLPGILSDFMCSIAQPGSSLLSELSMPNNIHENNTYSAQGYDTLSGGSLRSSLRKGTTVEDGYRSTVLSSKA